MAKNPKPAPPTEASPLPAPEERWVALKDGWYCGRLMAAGDPVTHVDRLQLLADDGQRVARQVEG